MSNGSKPHLTSPADRCRVERVDDRRFISGIVHVLKSGCKPIEQILHARFCCGA
jgi:hypothetical protein